jgi:hypothetical protein
MERPKTGSRVSKRLRSHDASGIGDLFLVFERELFGQEPLNEIHGPRVDEQLEKKLGRLAETMLPLQERAARVMMRSLEALGPSRTGDQPNSHRRRRRKI